MKKIGILTYHRAVNYGAFLQCLSLVKLLQAKFPQYKIEVIDYETKTEFYIKIKSLLKSNGVVDFFRKLTMFFHFYSEVHSYLPLSKRRIISNKSGVIRKYYSNEYEIIIVGSDAVWNNVNNEAKLNFFLKDVACCYKFSYAASTSGLNSQNISEQTYLYLQKALVDFYYIGVREEKSEHFIKRISEKLHCEHNCDPTCFLNLNEFKDNIRERLISNRISIDKPIVCLMTANETVGRYVYQEFHKTHQIISIYTYNPFADLVLYDLRPTEFAVFFSHIDILFSYFFHGAYLCLRNGTPVIAVDQAIESDGEKSKIKYLFERLGIDKWYFRPNEMNKNDFNDMLSLAQSLINTSQKDRLAKALLNESQYSESFINSLSNLIQNNCE